MIYKLLSEDEEVMGKVTKIYPVIADVAELPYIYYRRFDGEYTPVKTGVGADTSIVEINCCAEDYESAVDLAELVRKVLDGRSASDQEMTMRVCRYVRSEDVYQDDAHKVVMEFKVSIN